MAHKKYIKRGGKIFGPYLYENYRLNGITKTRYLGKGKEEKKKEKKLNRRKLRGNKNIFKAFILHFIIR